MKKHSNSIIVIIGLVSALAAVVATITSICIYNSKKKHDEKELEHYLDNSII